MARWVKNCCATLLFCFATSTYAKEKTRYVYGGYYKPNYSLNVDTKPAPDDPNTKMSNVNFDASANLAATVGFSFNEFEIGATFDINNEPGSDEFGDPLIKTKVSKYDLKYFFERVGISSNYTDLKGMQIDSVTGISPDQLRGDPEVMRPDIRLRSTAVNIWALPFAYNLTLDNYFSPAADSKGCGIGLVAFGSYNRLKIDAEKPLVAEKFGDPFGEDAAISSGEFTTISGGFGPVVTLEFYGIYASSMLTYGSGSQSMKYKVGGENGDQRTKGGVAQKMLFHMGFGYKGSTFFLANDYFTESPEFKLNSIYLDTSQGYTTLTFGFRY